ncbi:hypothetical protein E4T47_08044 [Aureobasidium subglaciale]|nr:hypothetical protein E4T47_08044 [Aureobasidium subglaciale]
MLTAKSPALYVFLTASLFWMTAFWYCSAHFFRDPGSAFYDGSRAFNRLYSSVREGQATRFLESPVALTKASRSASLCASFQSVRREGQQSLDLAILSALEGLSLQERADIYVSAFIAHPLPEEHPSWHNNTLHELVDDFHSYNVSFTQLETIQEYEKTHNYERKGVLDHVYGLEHCLNETQAPWIAMFEDDIIFADGWLAYTLSSLADLEANIKSKTSGPHEWLFLRLFNQERSTGWASKKIGGNHEDLISLAIAIPLVAAVLALRKRFRRAKRYVDNWTLMTVCFIVIPAFVILYFQAGKASLLPPQPGVRQEAFGCCSQGLVFPRDIVLRVVESLRDRGSGQVDLILNDIAKDEGLAVYAQYPVMIQHFGGNSVRGTESGEAQAIWSMAFEALSVRGLEQQHIYMVRRRYGTLWLADEDSTSI